MKKGDKFILKDTGELLIFDNCIGGQYDFERPNRKEGQKKFLFFTFNPYPEFISKVE